MMAPMLVREPWPSGDSAAGKARRDLCRPPRNDLPRHDVRTEGSVRVDGGLRCARGDRM
jgi:hypothetical protein